MAAKPFSPERSELWRVLSIVTRGNGRSTLFANTDPSHRHCGNILGGAAIIGATNEKLMPAVNAKRQGDFIGNHHSKIE